MPNTQYTYKTRRGKVLSEDTKCNNYFVSLSHVGAEPLLDILKARVVTKDVASTSKSIAKKHKVNIYDLHNATMLAIVFFVLDDGETLLEDYNEVIKELTDSKVIELKVANQVVAILDILNRNTEVIAALQVDYEDQGNIKAAFPTFKDCWLRCASIGDYSPKGSDLSLSKELYNPKLLRLIPVALVQIDIDKFGIEESFSFALTAIDLKRFIKRLEYTLKQLEVMQEQTKLIKPI